ncbi:MAG: hypothetical protein ACOVP6_10200 [Lacibacter sp.]
MNLLHSTENPNKLQDTYRLHLKIIQVMSACWLLQKLISRKLWLTNRNFPLLECHPSLAHFPEFLHLPLWIASLVFLSCLILFPDSRKLITLLILTELLSCLPDQNRWQPWEYQFLTMLFIYQISRKENEKATAWLIFLTAAIYIWSGISKLNPMFAYNVWKEQILETFLNLNVSTHASIPVTLTGYFPGLYESITGIGLLYSNTRRLSAHLLLGMHLFILAFIGPLGIQHNAIVWPWNLTMIGILFLLRDNAFQIQWKPFLKLGKFTIVLCLLWGVLPLLSFVGLWDRYLSARLYSGTSPRVIICTSLPVQKTSVNNNPIQSDSSFPCKPERMISLNKWALEELKVPIYPEERVPRLLKKKLKLQHPHEQFDFYIAKPIRPDSLIWIPF